MITSIFISVIFNCIKIVFIIIKLLLLTIVNEAFRKENISHPVFLSVCSHGRQRRNEGGFTIQAHF